MRLTLFRQTHDIPKSWYATYGLRSTDEVQEVGIPVCDIWSTKDEVQEVGIPVCDIWSTKELHWVEITVRNIWSTNMLSGILGRDIWSTNKNK